MTETEAIELIRKLLQARDEAALVELVNLHLHEIDGTFFGAVERSVRELEREEKPEIARALRGLSDRMLRMRTLI